MQLSGSTYMCQWESRLWLWCIYVLSRAGPIRGNRAVVERKRLCLYDSKVTQYVTTGGKRPCGEFYINAMYRISGLSMIITAPGYEYI